MSLPEIEPSNYELYHKAMEVRLRKSTVGINPSAESSNALVVW